MRKAATVLASVGLCVLTTPACYGHECEGDVYPPPSALPYGYGPGEGDLVDESTWESVGMNDPAVPAPPCVDDQLGDGTSCRPLSAWRADTTGLCHGAGKDFGTVDGTSPCQAPGTVAPGDPTFSKVSYRCCDRPTPLPGHRWMDFSAGRTWRVAVPAWTDEQEGRPFVAMHGYVSFGSMPNQQLQCDQEYCQPSDNWSEATGNLVEFSQIEHGRLYVKNHTCVQFYLRLVLHAGSPTRAASVRAERQGLQ